MKISVGEITLGSVLKILGEGPTGEHETWYGQVEAKRGDMLEVALLTPKGDLLEFSGSYVPQEIPVESIMAFQKIRDLADKDEHKKAWASIGVRLISSSAEKDVFIELDKEDEAQEHDIGDDSYESSAESEYEYDDFVVPDDEPFSHADAAASEVRPGGAAVVDDIHRAVLAFNEWVPEDERDKELRAAMEAHEAKFAARDDERQFLNGTSVSYTKPPAPIGLPAPPLTEAEKEALRVLSQRFKKK